MKTTSKILTKDFNFEAKHIGLFLDDNLWPHDKWIVTIEGQVFDYSTGIGHREYDRNKAFGKEGKEKFVNIMSRNNLKQTKENLTLYNDELLKVSKVKPLEIDDVLYSLLIDASLSDGDFEDFCSNIGANIDSMKSFETYQACQKNRKKLKTFITDIDKAQELFQDY